MHIQSLPKALRMTDFVGIEPQTRRSWVQHVTHSTTYPQASSCENDLPNQGQFILLFFLFRIHLFYVV